MKAARTLARKRPSKIDGATKKIKYDASDDRDETTSLPTVLKQKTSRTATVEVLVELASSSTRVWRTSTLNNRPESDVADEKCGPTPADYLVAYAPTSSYEEEEVEAFYMDRRSSPRRSCLYKVIIGDFNAKVGPRRTPEELHRDPRPTMETRERLPSSHDDKTIQGTAIPEALPRGRGVTRWRVPRDRPHHRQ
ncbi:hypothetical protein RB195_014947 [Necator americanus]|uniref:Endonuclease/exonuclease/phosphatase domain-containing protein n=1 Tax=Necator americanus TaxID=51031 RepID=A0ABR1E417_NECAM